jgi:hypothetical protein
VIVPIVYIVVFLLTFFAASFAVARYCHGEDPIKPETFFLLAGYALMWPVTVPLFAAILLLMGIAILAEKLTGGAK